MISENKNGVVDFSQEELLKKLVKDYSKQDSSNFPIEKDFTQ
jgi:hypothetical protein